MFYRELSKKFMTKIPTKANDAAPMIFFIDILHNETFHNPILPMPSRIDKITNGLPSLFCYPTHSIFQISNEMVYTYNLEKIYSSLVENLITYAIFKYKQLIYRQLNINLIHQWWERTTCLIGTLHSYDQDIEFILNLYLSAFLRYLDHGDERQALIYYCDKMINYIDERIKNNTITFHFKKELIEKRMYKEKKKYFFPDIYEFDIRDITKEKVFQKAFVPVLVYDDLMECFLYNKMILDPEEWNKMSSPSQDPDKKSSASESDLTQSPPQPISFNEVLEKGYILKIPQKDWTDSYKPLNEVVKKISIEDILNKIEEID